MSEDGPRDVGGEVPARPAGDVGWEPSDWSACFRREHHKQLALAIGLVVVAGAVLLTGPPGLSDWLTTACLLIVAVETVYSFVSAEGREKWERETRQTVRVRHALRHHSSIGAADRALVTDRARHTATWSTVAFVGWPLLAVALVGRGLEVADPPTSLMVLGIVACLLLVARAVQRLRRARRWLADPLPRDEEPSWT